MNHRGGGGERRNLKVSSSPLPLPLQPFFFCFRSNFRAITRFETLATQAMRWEVLLFHWYLVSTRNNKECGYVLSHMQRTLVESCSINKSPHWIYWNRDITQLIKCIFSRFFFAVPCVPGTENTVTTIVKTNKPFVGNGEKQYKVGYRYRCQ